MAIGVTGLTVHTQTGAGTWKDYGSGGGSAANTNVFLSSTGSRARKISNGVKGFAFEVNASGTDLSSSILLVRWATLAGVGTLNTLALDGVRFVVEDTSGNISYWTIAGNDTYAGGWEVSVIDTALTETANSGTAAILTLVRYVGIEWDETASVGGGDPNCYIDEVLSMPNTGLTITGDSTSLIADIQAWDDASDYGIFETKGGIIFSKVPLILSPGASDFTSTDEILVFEEKIYEDGTNIDAAIGTLSLSSADSDVIQFNRFTCIAEDNGDINGTNATKQVDFGSATGIDCNVANFSGFIASTSYTSIDLGATGNTYNDVSFVGNDSMDHSSGATLDGCNFINAATADGEAAIRTDNPSNFTNCTWTFSDGHGIEVDANGTFSFDGNVFNNYGADASNDAAVYNSVASGTLTLNLQNVSVAPTVRTASGGETNADITVGVSITTLDADDSTAITSARVLLLADTGGDLPAEDAVTLGISTNTVTVTHTSHGLSTGDKVLIAGVTNEQVYNGIQTITVTTVNAYTYTVTGSPASPTGSATSTSVILDGTTNGSGVIEDTAFVFTTTQPVTGRARKGTSSTYYKTSAITGSISSTGLDTTIFLIKDE